MAKKKKIPQKLQPWVEARTKFKLSHSHIQMARELGLNPRKLGKIANSKQEVWKSPLPVFIEDLYEKRFGKRRPDEILSIEQHAKRVELKKAKRRERRAQKAKETEEINTMSADDRRFAAIGHYAESILRSSLGDNEASVQSLKYALETDSEYAPAILSMGSIEYQQLRTDLGKELLFSLVSLPATAADEGESDLAVIIDKAGDFLIQAGNYTDGLELYKAAVARFPDHAVFHQGVCCCAGHEGLYEEAVTASGAALELEPENQECVNDHGWSLFEAGRLDEAKRLLTRAVDMNPSDKLARENLRFCNETISRGGSET